jgi:hypothetical protein
MKTLFRALLVAGPLLVGLGASRADAQVVITRGYSVVRPAPVAVAPTLVPSVATYGVISRPTVGTSYIPPYSYYVVPNPYPKRYYSGYGNNDFPFYGRPYGRPYDAWTWPYLSGGYDKGMARYFYPPL